MCGARATVEEAQESGSVLLPHESSISIPSPCPSPGGPGGRGNAYPHARRSRSSVLPSRADGAHRRNAAGPLTVTTRTPSAPLDSVTQPDGRPCRSVGDAGRRRSASSPTRISNTITGSPRSWCAESPRSPAWRCSPQSQPTSSSTPPRSSRGRRAPRNDRRCRDSLRDPRSSRTGSERSKMRMRARNARARYVDDRPNRIRSPTTARRHNLVASCGLSQPLVASVSTRDGRAEKRALSLRERARGEGEYSWIRRLARAPTWRKPPLPRLRHWPPVVKRWLEKRPRFHLHFTPTSGSWLNGVDAQRSCCHMIFRRTSVTRD